MLEPKKVPSRIVSGGQTGADRAALDFAIARGFPHGGWVPAGRAAEDGPLAPLYVVQETPDAAVEVRTEWNVRDSDATLIVTMGPLLAGSLYTWQMAGKHKKPCLHVDLAVQNPSDAAGTVLQWFGETGPDVLNVAGPRASTEPGIYIKILDLLCRVFPDGQRLLHELGGKLAGVISIEESAAYLRRNAEESRKNQRG